jgi:hypothetical protein
VTDATNIVTQWFLTEMSQFRQGRLGAMTNTMLEMLTQEVKDMGHTIGPVTVIVTFERRIFNTSSNQYGDYVACCVNDAEVVRVTGNAVTYPP